MTLDHTGLFSTNAPKSSEPLAMNELAETLALPSLDEGHWLTTPGRNLFFTTR